MSYRVRRDQDGTPSITLAGEPAYCHALAADVPAREAELNSGLWLVMAFAVWSGPDVESVQDALDLARRLGGRLNLGLRPYDDPLELQAWWPGADTDASGPFWILLRDGTVCQYGAGRMSAGELDQLARTGAAEAVPPRTSETRFDGCT